MLLDKQAYGKLFHVSCCPIPESQSPGWRRLDSLCGSAKQRHQVRRALVGDRQSLGGQLLQGLQADSFGFHVRIDGDENAPPLRVTPVTTSTRVRPSSIAAYMPLSPFMVDEIEKQAALSLAEAIFRPEPIRSWVVAKFLLTERRVARRADSHVISRRSNKGQIVAITQINAKSA